MNVSDITGATAAAQEVQRTTAVMARTLRIEREQAAATVALIEQARQPAPAADGTGRLLDRWA
jgi:hypothetical protein